MFEKTGLSPKTNVEGGGICSSIAVHVPSCQGFWGAPAVFGVGVTLIGGIQRGYTVYTLDYVVAV